MRGINTKGGTVNIKLDRESYTVAEAEKLACAILDATDRITSRLREKKAKARAEDHGRFWR